MNFFDNGQNNQMMPMMNPNINPMINNDLIYRLNEIENKIKKLEQKIKILESNKPGNNYNEPDTSLYMI